MEQNNRDIRAREPKSAPEDSQPAGHPERLAGAADALPTVGVKMNVRAKVVQLK